MFNTSSIFATFVLTDICLKESEGKIIGVSQINAIPLLLEYASIRVNFIFFLKCSEGILFQTNCQFPKLHWATLNFFTDITVVLIQTDQLVRC